MRHGFRWHRPRWGRLVAQVHEPVHDADQDRSAQNVADGEAVELVVQPRVSGIRFLLVTDGLWGILRDEEIEAALRSSPASAIDCCERLVLAATQSTDNVTAMVVDLW